MLSKKNYTVITVYLLFVSILLGGVFGIIDYRLGLDNRFSLINDFIAVIFIIAVMKEFFLNRWVRLGLFKQIYWIGGIYVFYITLEIVLSIVWNNEIVSSILGIKNLLMPVMIFYFGIFIIKKLKGLNFRVLLKFLNIISVINIIMVFLGLIFGWQVITKYVLGEPLYAFSVYSFGNSSTLERVPGIFVDALTQGSFSFMVFIFNFISLRKSTSKSKKYEIIFTFIGILGIILSTNRQVILAFIVVCIVMFGMKRKKIFISIIIFGTAVFILFLLGVRDSNKAIFSVESLGMRTGVWNDIISDMDLEHNVSRILIGTGVDATTLGKDELGLDLVDNSYLLFFHDYGTIGLIIFLVFMGWILKFLYNNLGKSIQGDIAFYYIIYFFIRMIFHSSIINEYDSYMLFLILLFGFVDVVKSDDQEEIS